MTEIILITLLGLNTVAAIVYLLLYLQKGQKNKGIVGSLFIFVTPVVGALFLLCAEGVNRLLFHKRDDLLSEEELSFSKKRIRIITSADIEKESDNVPVEEALLVSNKHSRRKIFLELLKKDDYEMSLDMIKQAVENDDMEISHYAATFVTDTIDRYKKQEEQLRQAYEEEPCERTRIAYIQYLCEILMYHVFSAPEQRRYLEWLNEQMEELKKENPYAMNGQMISTIVTLWEEQNQWDQVENWMISARLLCDNDLAAVKLCLKYYYRMGQKERFFDLLKELKQSALELDSETLDWVRYYSNNGV